MTSTIDLGDLMRGPVLLPGDDGYDAARSGYQLSGRHEPDVVVGATGPADVRAAVELAASRGLPVTAQATGHGLPVPGRGGVLIDTSRMTGVRITGSSAWLAAGVRWGQVIHEAAPYGLAPLSGSSPYVGAVSYTLGGGIGLLSRGYGFAADHVRAIEVVTADAVPRRVTAGDEPELFWALRGGRSNFGVVIGLEIGLLPVATLYGGGLYFDLGEVPGILTAWRDWTATVPEEMNSSIALIRFPGAAPGPLRGRHVAHVRIAWTGGQATGERLVDALRAAGPRLVDTVGELPYSRSATIHNEPADPMAYHASHGLVTELDDTGVRAVLDAAADGCVAEVRQLGGAMSRPPEAPSAVGHRGARYLAGVLSLADADTGRAAHERFLAAIAPVTLGRNINFLYGDAATAEAVRTAYEPADYDRLARLKAVYDPANLFRHNHNIPPAR